MFRESPAKVKQSHGATHALLPGRSGKHLRTGLFGSIVLLIMAGLIGIIPTGTAKAADPTFAAPPTTSLDPAQLLPSGPSINTAEAAGRAIERLDANLKKLHDIRVLQRAQVKYLLDVDAWDKAVARDRFIIAVRANEAAALRRRLTKALIPYDFGLWMKVHICEQGDTWHAGGHFGNGLPAGGNGLGFSLYAWKMGVGMAAKRGVTIPASGWHATPDQQMQLAQAVLDATGGGPDCLKRFPH